MQSIPIVGSSIWFVAKIAILIFLLMYVIFAVVVQRQVHLMIQTLDIGFDKAIKLIAALHLILAIGVFILSLIIL